MLAVARRAVCPAGVELSECDTGKPEPSDQQLRRIRKSRAEMCGRQGRGILDWRGFDRCRQNLACSHQSRFQRLASEGSLAATFCDGSCVGAGRTEKLA